MRLVAQPARWGLLLVAILTLMTTQASCLRDSGTPRDYDALGIDALELRTIPTGSRIVSHVSPSREGFSLTASWEFETEMQWGSYADWLRRQLPQEYTPIRFGETSLLFSKSMEGDSLSVEVVRVDSGAPLRVRVRFLAHPN